MKFKVFSFDNESKVGVLRNMFNSVDYWNLFEYKATGHSASHLEEYAFNFSTNNYWIGARSEYPHNLSFCFKYFSVLPIGYEIKTSFYSAETDGRAKEWGFSGSNDGETWQYYETVDHLLAANEIYYVPWSPQTRFRCFRITTIRGNGGYVNRFDLSTIDVYGEIILNPRTYNQKSFIKFPFYVLLFLY